MKGRSKSVEEGLSKEVKFGGGLDGDVGGERSRLWVGGPCVWGTEVW